MSACRTRLRRCTLSRLQSSLPAQFKKALMVVSGGATATLARIQQWSPINRNSRIDDDIDYLQRVAYVPRGLAPAVFAAASRT
ncbi:hypothetical protein D3C71_1537400 [compost metagenome]